LTKSASITSNLESWESHFPIVFRRNSNVSPKSIFENCWCLCPCIPQIWRWWTIFECRKCIHQQVVTLPASCQHLKGPEACGHFTKHESSSLANCSRLVSFLCWPSASGHKDIQLKNEAYSEEIIVTRSRIFNTSAFNCSNPAFVLCSICLNPLFAAALDLAAVVLQPGKYRTQSCSPEDLQKRS
jgi:hypothetical protein